MSDTVSAPSIVWQAGSVTPAMREHRNGHRGLVLWFTGLSGAGKSTLVHAVEARLHERGRRAFVLDGDNLRHGLCAGLGFSAADRSENLRRAAEVARLFADAGTLTLAAFISPLRDDRARVRAIVGAARFVEVFVACPLSVCEARDVKGLYRRARADEIPDFTGISAPYEAPEHPGLTLDTSRMSIDACVAAVLAYVEGVAGLGGEGSDREADAAPRDAVAPPSACVPDAVYLQGG